MPARSESRVMRPKKSSASISRSSIPTRIGRPICRSARWRRPCKDGRRFWSSVTISPLRDPSGRLVGFAKITRDISERREQQIALDQAHEALAQSQKMDALGQLSGGVAHDFNNLLHVITNCVEIVQRRKHDADAETRQFLDMIKRSASRAASLTQRMLAFSRRQPL